MSLKEIPPHEIRRNAENPRIHFPVAQLEELTRSIYEQGVLVPVSVYEEPNGNTNYVLIDGERRWTCATNLNLATIPAWVLPKPDSVHNLLTMFNIHMVREQWDDMPTAWALQKLMDRTGFTDSHRLAEMTGLSENRVKALQIALKLPEDYQEKIDSGDIPLNFFVELDSRVVRPLKTQRPLVFADLGGEDHIVQGFVDKRLAGNVPDVVNLRKVKQIINVASAEAGGADVTSDLDAEIVKLVNDKSQTIDAAYEETVEMVVETESFIRQCDRLHRRLERLLSKNPTDEDINAIEVAVQELVSKLQATISSIDS